MVTINSALKCISAYPISDEVITNVCTKRGLTPTDELTSATFATSPYQLSKADIMIYLSQAPDVSEGGVSFSFSDAQKSYYRKSAMEIYKTLEDSDSIAQLNNYGYKGSRL